MSRTYGLRVIAARIPLGRGRVRSCLGKWVVLLLPGVVATLVSFQVGLCGSDGAAGAMAGVTTDGAGGFYQVTGSGGLARRDASGSRTEIARVTGEVSDLVLDASGNLVVATFGPGPEAERTSPRGCLQIYSPDGTKLRDVALPARWWPQRVATLGERVAVLASSPEEGYAVHFLSRDYKLMPDARFYVSFPCEGLDLLAMAADQDGTGLWIAPLQICEGGYAVHHYDRHGQFLVKLTAQLDPLPEPPSPPGEGRPRPSIVPALTDVFILGDRIGAVLNKATQDGVVVDLWTSAGVFDRRATLAGVRSAFVRVVPQGADWVDVIALDQGDVVRIGAEALSGGRP